MGLVNYIVEPDELLAKSRELLSIINEKAPLAIARIIECANIAAGDGLAVPTEEWEADPFGGDAPGSSSHSGSNTTHSSGSSHKGSSRSYSSTSMRNGDTLSGGSGVRNGFLREQAAFGECFGTEDMKEGTTAFLEKRKAHFKGK